MKSAFACALVAACSHGEAVSPSDLEAANGAKLAVTSTAFAADGAIPSEYTCEGANTAPDLAWSGAPATTRSFAIIADDPDAPDPAAPKQTWVHWVLFDIPATAARVPATGAVNGTNDFKKLGYGGPCPPIGTHRYVFKVYALDTTIGKPGLTKAELLAAMRGHVVARGELIGRYQKRAPR